MSGIRFMAGVRSGGEIFCADYRKLENKLFIGREGLRAGFICAEVLKSADT